MKKILILANNDVGLYKFRKELIQELIDRGNKVYISLPDGEYVKALINMGCQYLKTEFNRRGMNPFKDLKLLLFYHKIISNVNPDVVLTYTIKPNIYGGIVCHLKKVKYIMNITGLGTAIENKRCLSKILLHMYGFSARKATKVFFQNNENKRYFEENNLVNNNVELIPGSGVNLSEHCYEKYPDDNGKLRFLFIGRIMKDKGIEEFLDCAEEITKIHKNISFDIVGGFDEEIYRTRIQNLEKASIVKYFGQQDDIHSFIAQHHATILPSYHEGLSNVLLESAAVGRPILASDIYGCKETFDDNISGMAFQPKNSQALTKIVNKFIDLSYAEKKNMGLQGRRKMEKEFDRNIVINAYMREIDK